MNGSLTLGQYIAVGLLFVTLGGVLYWGFTLDIRGLNGAFVSFVLFCVFALISSPDKEEAKGE